MTTECHLVLLEVAGIQRFVFATNKRAENAGASELISALQERVRSAADAAGDEVELVLVSSGKAMATTTSRARAVELVRDVTCWMLEAAPGVDVIGAIVGPVADDDRGMALAVRTVHRRAARLRSERPGPDLRFARLPWVAECQTSGLPAAGVGDHDPEKLDRSAVSLTKRTAWREQAIGRFADLLAVEPATVVRWARQLEAPTPGSTSANSNGNEDTQIDDGGAGDEPANPVEWVGVVHADGNGIGTLLQQPSWMTKTGGRYLEALRDVSEALHRVTLGAFAQARDAIRPDTPILPLIVGGDDLTVVLDGAEALTFAVAFLRAFEDLSAADEVLAAVARAAHDRDDIPWLSACAGVAVVKPHFPFSTSYDLAAELTESAKVAAGHHWPHAAARADGASPPTPVSAIDFHQLHDTSSAGLGDIRARLQVIEADGTIRSLVRRPYLTTRPERLTGVLGLADIADRHGWDRLESLAAALDWQTKGEVPSSQILPLRSTMYQSGDQVKNELEHLANRYPSSRLAWLVSAEDWPDDPGGWLLDALDAAELGLGR